MTSVTLLLDRWGINMSKRANIPVFQPVQTTLDHRKPVQAALDHRKMAQTSDLQDDLRFIQQRREQNPSQQVGGFRNQPKDFMTQGIQNLQRRNRDALESPREEISINTEEEVIGNMSPEDKEEHIEKVTRLALWDDLVSRSLGPEAEKKLSEASKNLLGISRVDENISINEEVIPTAQGGLIGMALGGKFEGRVRGDGHGMQDNVFMPIQERGEQVATLAVSPKEYVVDAHTMSALGNGNADKGADVMDNVVENIREKAYGTDQQPNQIDGLAALRPMMERV